MSAANLYLFASDFVSSAISVKMLLKFAIEGFFCENKILKRFRYFAFSTFLTSLLALPAAKRHL